MDGINLILQLRHVGDRPDRRCCSRSASSSATTMVGGRRCRGVVAGVVAMVPEGLVLLTSLAFAVAAVHARPPPRARAGAARGRGARARRRGLPRQDRHPHRGRRSCSTTLEPLGDDRPGRRRARRARGRREPQRHRSQRSREALRRAGTAWARTGAVPFSSARKWSAATFDGQRHVGARRARDGAGSTGAAERPGPAPAPTSSRPRAGGCCSSRTPTQPLAGEQLPGGLEAGRARAARGEGATPTPPRRSRTSPSRASRSR